MYAELTRKVCSGCKQIKISTDFYKRTASRDGLSYLCKVCDTDRHRQFTKNNKELVFERRKAFRQANKERLSISKNRAKCSPEVFKKLFAEQEGKCAICGLHQDKMRRRIAIDHDHVTKAVRGLLCDNCNRCIGLLKDDETILIKAVEYLKKHKKIG